MPDDTTESTMIKIIDCETHREKLHGRISYYVKAVFGGAFLLMGVVGGLYMFVWKATAAQDVKITTNEKAIISTQKDIEYMKEGMDEQKGMMREQNVLQMKVLEEIQELKK